MPRGYVGANMGYMTTVGGLSASEASLVLLLRDSGLASAKQLDDAALEAELSEFAIDELLVLDPAELRAVMSHAWRIPVVDLATEWIDTDLVRRFEWSAYLEQHWFPVRDQANGSVLVATSREPEAELTAAIEEVVTSRVEYTAATSADIRAAVERVFSPTTVIRSWRLAPRGARPRD
ncbi:MAG: ral secretory system protein [Microbacteriaceae bacterium]|nr:ral secretory system protein [Microbacteriaceae bacterium]